MPGKIGRTPCCRRARVLLYPPPGKAFVAPIQNKRLPGRDGALRRIEPDLQAAVIAHDHLAGLVFLAVTRLGGTGKDAGRWRSSARRTT